MVSDMILRYFLSRIGKKIRFFDLKDFYYEGVLLAFDGEWLRYNDRVQGVKIVSISHVKEVRA